MTFWESKKKWKCLEGFFFIFFLMKQKEETFTFIDLIWYIVLFEACPEIGFDCVMLSNELISWKHLKDERKVVFFLRNFQKSLLSFLTKMSSFLTITTNSFSSFCLFYLRLTRSLNWRILIVDEIPGTIMKNHTKQVLQKQKPKTYRNSWPAIFFLCFPLLLKFLHHQKQ